jgi:DNA-binding beta-propeller fold protein YncE
MRRRQIGRSAAAALLAVVVTGAGIGLVTGSSQAGPDLSLEASRSGGRVGPSLLMTQNGRRLRPEGTLTQVGDFPTGGALTKDGRFYWAVDAGHGKDDVQVVDIASNQVVQKLPLPGAYGGIAFSPDGTRAYVSGEPKGNSTPDGPTVADAGDAVHVFAVDQTRGHGTELAPIELPATSGGTAQTSEGGKLGWPEGLSVTPDGHLLLVALNQADELAIVDLTTPGSPARLVRVGKFPYDVAADGSHTAYVSNELDGTVSVVDLDSATVVTSIGVGGAGGDFESHPEALVLDASRHLLFAAVANRDLIAVVDTTTRQVVHSVSVARPVGPGTAPISLAETPDGATLYAADSGEDALAAIALTDRTHGHQPPGSDGSVKAFTLIGRIPTAAYPSAVAVTPDGERVVWLAAKGLGAGPNPDYGQHFANSDAAPYGSYVIDKLLGYVGVLDRPSDRALKRLSAKADDQVRPANWQTAPVNTPLIGPDGGPSSQITHVFYIVRENRTYDQVFGSNPRGDGDPSLEVVDDNGRPGPAGGVTPNAHALSRMFPLLDHVYADSEVSTDGHVITSSAYAIDFVEKALHADYSGRGHVNNSGLFPETFPPDDFIFDQAVKQNVSFTNFGEFSAGLVNDGRPTYAAVNSRQDFTYPFHFGCDGTPPSLSCSTDSGTVGAPGNPSVSRFDHFQQKFDQWTVNNTDQVPSFVYLTLPNDHTNGVTPGKPSPKALIADNDLGLGQIVQLISHSSIWPHTAIFVVEDDSQDGADHVDAHRMPAFVISPYARHGTVVSTRYDQYSVVRTIELILGLHPLSLFDGMATPMYNAFTPVPDDTPFDAIEPTQSLTEVNPPLAPDSPEARLAGQLPFDHVDLVPQELSDDILWYSVYGWHSTPPLPGPGASPEEHARAVAAIEAFREHHDITGTLDAIGASDPDG